MDEVYRGYTWTPINDTDYRYAPPLRIHHFPTCMDLLSFFFPFHSCTLVYCPLQSGSGVTTLQWVLHAGGSERRDATAPVWVQGDGVVNYKLVWKSYQPFCLCAFRYAVSATQLLWIIRTCVSGSKVTTSLFSLSVLLSERTQLMYAFVSSGNTVNGCSFLIITHSSCRTSCLSCWTFPPSLTNVRAVKDSSCCHCGRTQTG